MIAQNFSQLLKQPSNNPVNAVLLGLLIKDYRRKNYISAEEFAKTVGCSICTLSKIESGKQQARSSLVLAILCYISKEVSDTLTLMLIDIEGRLNKQ